MFSTADADPERRANIQDITIYDSTWLIADANGNIIKLIMTEDKKDCDQTIIKKTNSGVLRDLIVSPILNCSITIGEDGVVRLWDYVNMDEYYN